MEGFIGRILKYGTLVCTYGLIGTVSLQIFARFFLAQAPAWTEEAARLFFIYAVSFAAGIALKNKYYVHLDLFYNRLNNKTKRIIDIGIPLMIFLLFLTMTLFSFQFIFMGHIETSPSMKVPMSVAFFSMFIMAASLSYYAALELKKALKD